MAATKANDSKGDTLAFMSAPRSRYMKASAELTQFLNWLVTTAIHLDSAVRTIVKVERRAGHIDENRHRRELRVGAGASGKTKVFYRMITEMALCRAVDNYLSYLTELLFLIFRASPESLRSIEKLIRSRTKE